MSYHTAIVGQTGSGKSFLAQTLARALVKSGARVVVFNPLQDAGWLSVGAAAVVPEPERFFQYAEKNQRLCLFCEEVRILGNTHERKNRLADLACYGRHRGHRLFFLMQRGNQCLPEVRDNCANLYMFRNGRAGAAFWEDAFGYPELVARAPLLPPHACMFCTLTKPPSFIKLKV